MVPALRHAYHAVQLAFKAEPDAAKYAWAVGMQFVQWHNLAATEAHEIEVLIACVGSLPHTALTGGCGVRGIGLHCVLSPTVGAAETAGMGRADAVAFGFIA